MKLSHSMAV